MSEELQCLVETLGEAELSFTFKLSNMRKSNDKISVC